MNHDLIIRRTGTRPDATCSCGTWAIDGQPSIQEASDRHTQHAEEAALALDPLSDERAHEIRTRRSRISEGPWELEPEGRKYLIGNKRTQLATDVEHHDAQFFLHAPADIKALLDDRELATATIARLNQRVNSDLAHSDTLMRDRYAYKLQAETATAQVDIIRGVLAAWELTDDEITMFCNDIDPYQRARLWTIYQTRKSCAAEIQRLLAEVADAKPIEGPAETAPIDTAPTQ